MRSGAGGGRLYIRAYPGVPMTYGFKSAYSMPWTGVGTCSALPSSTTLPPSQGSSNRLPRSRSSAIDAFIAGGA